MILMLVAIHDGVERLDLNYQVQGSNSGSVCHLRMPPVVSSVIENL